MQEGKRKNIQGRELPMSPERRMFLFLEYIGKNLFAGINKKAVFKIKASKENYDKIV